MSTRTISISINIPLTLRDNDREKARVFHVRYRHSYVGLIVLTMCTQTMQLVSRRRGCAARVTTSVAKRTAPAPAPERERADCHLELAVRLAFGGNLLARRNLFDDRRLTSEWQVLFRGRK